MKLNIKNGIVQDNSILGASLKRDITPFVTRKHRPGTKSKKKKTVIHNADNVSRTATAQAHANLLKNMERQWPNHSMSRSQVSWHFVVDDEEIIQCIPIDEIAYCQGNALGNSEGISIEICDNMYNVDRSKYLKAEDNAAKLAAALNETLGLTSVQHNYYTGKNCPSKIRKEGRWNGYVNLINSYKGKSNVGGNKPTTPNKGDDDVDYSKRALIVYNNVVDLESAMSLIKFLEGSYIVDLINGKSFNKHDFSGYRKSNWRIAVGGKKEDYTSYINYHIAGKNREETKEKIADFRNHANHRDKYKV